MAGHDEAALLRLLLPGLPTGPACLLGPGDDAAVVAAPDARVVATTDLLVEGRDFRLDWSSGADVGWKSVVQNLADVAAMGGEATGLLVSLGLPDQLPLAWAVDLAGGLAQACTAHGTGVVGGDLSGSPVVLVSVTALGDLAGRDPVRRDGARPGDIVALAGAVGRAAAGLDLLRAGRGDLAPHLVAAQRRPHPPLDAGPAAARAGATAMIDVSDGLGTDLSRLAAASGVSIDIDSSWDDAQAAALADVAQALAAATAEAVDPRLWIRGGGEDHALLACFPAGCVLPAPFTRIGEVRRERGGRAPVTTGGDQPLIGGWDHFA